MSYLKHRVLFACYDFVDEEGVNEKRTAVVVPIKTEGQGAAQKISWTGSRGRTAITILH